MGLTVVTPPATDLVTLAEIKTHCRVDISDDDALLQGLVEAAREVVEGRTQRQYVTATYLLTLDGFPAWGICLPRPPLQEVVEVAYLDANGDSQVWDASNYVVDASTEPAVVVSAYGVCWPITYPHPAAVSVTFTAGYGDTNACPERAKMAVKLLAASWYENREAVITGTIVAEVPFAVRALCESLSFGRVY